MARLEQWMKSLIDLVDEPSDWWQWAGVLGGFLIAYILKRLIGIAFEKTETHFERVCVSVYNSLKGFRVLPFLAAIVLWVFYGVQYYSGRYCEITHSTVLFLSAFSLYNVANCLSKGKFMPRLVGTIMFGVFILDLFHLLEPVRQFFGSIQIPLGDIQIDVWKVVTAIASLLVLLWLVGLTNKFIDRSVKQNKSLPPSIRVLIGKASRMFLFVSAILISLKIAGVNLGALAFFSGALGLGLGFGLQKVISNLVSGVIILLDKSIKPGDVIEIGDTYGWINCLRTRYVSVLTRDRKEILIPNEDFVTNQVVNWSFSDTNVRIKANVGIAYGSDVDLAIECCQIAAQRVSRVLVEPSPRCLLMGFGDSAIDLQIRFWINDANGGVANVRSAVLLEIWREFKLKGIEIPFPQREIVVKNAAELLVK